MLREERRNQILSYLGAKGAVRTQELTRILQVSEETVRQDFVHLERLGELRRIHGGAVPVGATRYMLPLPEREALHREEKMAIAKIACGLVRERETVFLDASSTVLSMTAFFPDRESTVITNANHVIVSLSSRNKVSLICTGGDYELRSRSYTGILAEEALQRFLIQKMFLGVDGIDAERGASEVNGGQARLKERLIPIAQEVIVLADHTKLGRCSSFFSSSLDRIDRLITTRPEDPRILDEFRKNGVSVTVAD